MNNSTMMVNAWEGTHDDASYIPIRDLEILQKKFEGRLEIVRKTDGGISIIPQSRGDETNLAIFMQDLTCLTSEIIKVTPP